MWAFSHLRVLVFYMNVHDITNVLEVNKCSKPINMVFHVLLVACWFLLSSTRLLGR